MELELNWVKQLGGSFHAKIGKRLQSFNARHGFYQSAKVRHKQIIKQTTN